VPEAEMESCNAEMVFKMALARVGSNITDACAGLTDGEHKAMCEVHLAYNKYCSAMGSSLMNPVGGSFMASQSRYAKMCKRHREAWEENNSKDMPEDVRNQHLESANESSTNILLYDGADNGKYTDVAIERGVGFGGWTWNVKFADLDNDGWQDVYVTNGYSTTMSQSTKVFYRNKGDGYFEDATKPFGLEDYSNTSSYSYVDYDLDGDLDIIAVPLDGKVKIFRNDKGSAKGAIQIVLDDGKTGNKAAIGAKIIIRYQNEGREVAQVRSILASGGYKSFDAPVAHFGLGDAVSIQKIEVTWPDGRKDEIEGDFKAGGRYRISRNSL
jgi:ASPIC and UnbV/FG-GAP-like repeat